MGCSLQAGFRRIAQKFSPGRAMHKAGLVHHLQLEVEVEVEVEAKVARLRALWAPRAPLLEGY